MVRIMIAHLGWHRLSLIGMNALFLVVAAGVYVLTAAFADALLLHGLLLMWLCGRASRFLEAWRLASSPEVKATRAQEVPARPWPACVPVSPATNALVIGYGALLNGWRHAPSVPRQMPEREALIEAMIRKLWHDRQGHLAPGVQTLPADLSVLSDASGADAALPVPIALSPTTPQRRSRNAKA